MTEGVREPLRILDASVIVRYLSNDIPRLAEQARWLIDSDTPLGITTVALLETAHVLRNPPYGHSREAIGDALINLRQRENFHGVGVNTAHAAVALLLCRQSGTVSFGDALIVATGRSANLTEAYSFDAHFERAGLRVVPMPGRPPSD
ncbi:MAG: PIN domain-containing protein [Chloroflexota bacterium]|nr:PIN domain-containing protein [Chloroflexota bacterium]